MESNEYTDRVADNLTNFSAATGYELRLQPDGGGFYLAQVDGSSYSGLKSSTSSSGGFYLAQEKTKDSESSVDKPFVPPVNDNVALKIDNIKDSRSDMSTDDKPAVQQVDGDTLKVEISQGTKEVLVEKVASLKEEVASLKQKVQSLTEENGELNQEVEDNIRDVGVYMSESKLNIKALKEELQASKEFAKTIDEHTLKQLAEKIVDKQLHDREMMEMNVKVIQHMTEISQLKSKHVQREKIWNVVVEQLKNQLKTKSGSVDEVTKDMEALILDKSAQNNTIHELKTELESIKSENVRLLPSFDNVQKIKDELKLKVAELEAEVERQMEAMSGGDKK